MNKNKRINLIKKEVLGVKIDDVSLDQALALVETWLTPEKSYFGRKRESAKHLYVVTPNPEFVVASQDDQTFKEILNDADLSIPDGIGLKLFAGFKNRVAGVDFMERLISLCGEKGFTIGFLGGASGVAEKAAKCLRQRYQSVSINFVDQGGKVDENGWTDKRLEVPKLDILFVGYGMIKQEKWINKNLRRYPVKVAIGVGRSFDYLSGDLPRAPKVVRLFGFEWLFSLIMQPWRIKRQSRLLKFLWKLYGPRLPR